MLVEKFRKAVAGHFDDAQAARIEGLFAHDEQLDAMPVSEFMAAWVKG